MPRRRQRMKPRRSRLCPAWVPTTAATCRESVSHAQKRAVANTLARINRLGCFSPGRPEERRQEGDGEREEEEDSGRQTQAAQHRPPERGQAEVRGELAGGHNAMMMSPACADGVFGCLPQGQDQRAVRLDAHAGV